LIELSSSYKDPTFDFIMNDITIAIPTLNRYDLLHRLCDCLINDPQNIYNTRLFILDNGGQLLQSDYMKFLDGESSKVNIEVATPNYNLGVAGSWNYFARELGSCLVVNDDVIFSSEVISCFIEACRERPDSIIFENSKPNEGFSTFFINRPEELLNLGGFDESFNPAYFEDDDCRYRMRLIGNPVVKVDLHDWEHDNSSTLRSSSNEYYRNHLCLFQRNKKYYFLKWGGKPGMEKFSSPFGNPI